MKPRTSLMAYVISILVIFSLQGCSLIPCCNKVEYRDVPYKVFVQVPCVVKDIKCDTSGNDTDVVILLVECIVDLKKEAEVCRP